MRLARRPVCIIHAPTNLGLHPGGVEELGQALAREGLADRLGCTEFGTVGAPTYASVRDEVTHIYNGPAIASYSRRLAAVVRRAIDAGYFPLVLGGDCSILLANLLALRGRSGLLFVDGHTDCYEPAASTGEVAELELGYATGMTLGALSELRGRRALVDARDVVIVGPRDADESGWRTPPLEALTIDLAEVRSAGVSDAAGRALERLSTDGLTGFWVHLDVDVLDDQIMPAVDYRLPGGLSWQELGVLLNVALASGRALGAEVTIFNPNLDPDHDIRKALVSALTDALFVLDHDGRHVA